MRRYTNARLPYLTLRFAMVTSGAVRGGNV